jgi:hypothetical protein
MDWARWQEQNNHYLAASLAWLRKRLEAAGEAPAETPRAAWRWKPRVPAGDDALASAAAAREAAAQMDPAPALQLLADQLRLSPFERDVVLLCVAMELDSRTGALCARAQGDAGQPWPTFSLAFAVLEEPSWDALSPTRPLRYWQAIEIDQRAHQPITGAPLRADERILHYVKGLNAIDQRVAGLLSLVEPSGTLPPSQQALANDIAERWERVEGQAPVAVLVGPDEGAQRQVAGAAAQLLARRLYRLSAAALPTDQTERDRIARLWQREAALLPVALYVDTHEEEGAPEARGGLSRFFGAASRSDSFLFVAAREPVATTGFPSHTFEVTRPTLNEQEEAWREALTALPSAEREQAAARLAGQFGLNAAEIRAVAAETPAEPRDTYPARLWAECRDRSRPRLGTLAERIAPRATWDDLVVPGETDALLREMVAQVAARATVYTHWRFAERMNRGLGISALFAGESGTGKTMAAEVIANALDLALYRIDLSQVVSKYIGETEKNLQRVFDLLEGGGAILFFDEADALFGKRSEVRDSHDRYANIEVNYLLQRMETYTGLAILATNMKGSLDQAFVRRLRFIVPFAFPSPAERKVLWQKVFPQDLPTEALDWERLARFNLNGAGIHNVALNAAFLAAADGGVVTMPLVLRAARSEFRKTERPLSEAEFHA